MAVPGRYSVFLARTGVPQMLQNYPLHQLVYP